MNRMSASKAPTGKSAGITFGVVAVMALSLAGCQGTSTPDTATSATETATPAPSKLSRADQLKAMTAKIADFALQPLDKQYDPEGYAKLGKHVWDVSNDLRRWAGVAALQNDSCKFVDAIAVWEQATRSALAWHVVCGEERLVISEAQARGARSQFDPDATDADRRKYAKTDAPQTMSAAFANFDVGQAVVACDNVMKEASVDKGSYDPSWSWDEARNEETGQVVITKEYSAKNAMGGTLSGKYQCVVDAASNRIISLQARDALGAHVVYE
jgi:hypothetical protein